MPTEKQVESELLEDENGESYRIRQQNSGRENIKGGGEFPSTETPPEAPAPGAADDADNS